MQLLKLTTKISYSYREKREKNFLHVGMLAVFIQKMEVKLVFVKKAHVLAVEDAFAVFSTIAGTGNVFGSVVLQHHLSANSPEGTCNALESSKMVSGVVMSDKSFHRVKNLIARLLFANPLSHISMF